MLATNQEDDSTITTSGKIKDHLNQAAENGSRRYGEKPSIEYDAASAGHHEIPKDDSVQLGDYGKLDFPISHYCQSTGDPTWKASFLT